MRERVVDARPGGFGSAVYARVPLERSAAAAGQTVTATRLRLRGAPRVEFLAVHPRAPLSERNMEEWRADLRALPPATPHGAVAGG